MDRIMRLTIPTLIAVMLIAVLYVVFSASSKPSNTNPIAKYATGTLANLDTSETGKLAPGTPFINAEGNEVTYADFRGQVILVNFWATWCGPCEREMPSLGALQTARGGPGFKVVAISLDAPGDIDYAKRRLVELTGGTVDFYALTPEPDGWNVVYETGASGGFPTSLIFDAEGGRVAKLEGEADWASYEAVGLIDTILGR